MSDNKGFTLIEMIAVLVIGGIILVVAGMGVVKVTEGLVFAQKNASTSLKTQVAIIRLEKELHLATNIASSSSATQLTFTNSKSGGSFTYTLCQNSQNSTYIDLASGTSCNGGNHLIDNVIVNGLSFTYLALDGVTNVPADTAKVINVTFQVTGAQGVTSAFSIRITPNMI